MKKRDIKYREIVENGRVKYLFNYSVNVNGVRKKRQETFESRGEAEVRRAQLVLSLSQGKLGEDRKRRELTFEEGSEAYVSHVRGRKASWLRDKQSLNNARLVLSGKLLHEITLADIERHQDIRKDQVSPRTVNEETACLKRFFNHMIRMGHVGKNPVKEAKFLREPPGRVRYLSNEQSKLLLEKLPPHVKPLAILLMSTGMRVGEAKRLLWTDVDFGREVIIIRNSKNGERREIPMTDTLRKTLAAMPKKCDNVFCTPAGKPYSGTRGIWETFKRASSKAGIDDLHVHDLRHHFASSLRMKGVDLLDIKEYLGHKTLTMTMRYAHITTERRKQIIKCLDGDYVETPLSSKKGELVETSAVFSGSSEGVSEA